MVRKKLRGMLALLLSLSMAVGLMGGTALAAEGEEAGGGPPEVVEPAPTEEEPAPTEEEPAPVEELP